MTDTLVASNLKLGQEIEFSHILKRRVEDYSPDGILLRMSSWKVWRRVPNIDGYRDGIVVGKRTLQNGIRQWIEDEGFNFLPRERFEAYLIAYDLRRNPALVLPQDIILSGAL